MIKYIASRKDKINTTLILRFPNKKRFVIISLASKNLHIYLHNVSFEIGACCSLIYTFIYLLSF